VERINTALTSVMLGSFVSLVGLAVGSGRWSLDALKRADYTLLLPTFLSSSSSSASASSIGSCSPWAIPIFIQLLVYNEVVPLVASRLQDEAKVRKAIVLGSLAPLLMCIIWSCVSLGLVPYEPPILTASSGETMYTYDPLNKLLGASSMAGIIGKLFSVSVNVLAGSAICTTIIGCILASALFIEDTLHSSTTKVRKTRSNGGDDKAANRMTENMYRKIGTRSLAIVSSAIVALCGTNRDLYYRAIRLAGAGPVTLLYGLLPPLCNLRLCWKNGSTDNEVGVVRHRIHVATQMMLVMISLAILTASHVPR
jgi:amino acid permease